MDNNKGITVCGLSFFGALTIAFVVLKLCNVINWSWWAVLSPLWIQLVFFVVAFIVLLIAAWLVERKKDKC